MMHNALKGYNVTVLAYGQTNSGKTFTVRGGINQDADYQPGIILLTAASLFRSIEYLKTPEGIDQSLKEKNDTSDSSFHLPKDLDMKSTDLRQRHGPKISEIQEVNQETSQNQSSSRAPSGQQPSRMIQRNINISVSYMEIYNENVNDLLDPSKRNLDIRDVKGAVTVEHLTVKTVRSADEVRLLLERGEQVRIIAETKSNT